MELPRQAKKGCGLINNTRCLAVVMAGIKDQISTATGVLPAELIICHGPETQHVQMAFGVGSGRSADNRRRPCLSKKNKSALNALLPIDPSGKSTVLKDIQQCVVKC